MFSLKTRCFLWVGHGGREFKDSNLLTNETIKRIFLKGKVFAEPQNTNRRNLEFSFLSKNKVFPEG